MKKIIIITLLSFVAIIFQDCSKKDTTTTEITIPNLPNVTLNYLVSYPKHIQDSLNINDNTPIDNAITNDGATLGRVLFYDKKLSKNNTISCASCHKQNLSFDDDVAFSKGFEAGLTSRNSMGILNLRFYKSGKMFWDERAATLEKQVLQPIQNHVEMGLTLAELESKVSAQSYYPPLFLKAFGSAQVDTIKIAKALSQFCRSIVTYQSKYDLVKQGLATFTAQEQQGENVFLNVGVNTCASCHTPPMFITSSPKAPFTLADANDLGINNQMRFKSGSLRNVGIRTALFHNGSIANLQAMLTPTAGTPPIPAHTVAPQDVATLLAFLNTLTDNSILTEEKFSTPFK
ncbi:MAG: cytochrome-c peroxidase [Chitinophagaceae bacterium]